MPNITEEWKKMMEEKITMTELTEAIKKQQNNKTPGPDGLPAEFYKTFQDILGTPLLELFNELLSEGKIPDSWTQAYITLIPKKEANIQQIKNYRPISLLNVDYKIFAVIIAERLKRILRELIHPDQNGFLPNRQIRDNIRVILNVLEYYEIHPEKQMALIFVDAQKAFDNVNWQFMLKQFQMMNFGEKFIKMIKAIYTKQTAKIIINGEMTDSFEIEKGTRQGCPLSPLLFVTILEALNMKIRQDNEIKGLKIKKEEFKLQAFADDLVFILEEPEGSGTKLMQNIEQYGEVAGLKINKEKTKILVKNMNDKNIRQLESKLGLQIAKKIKYLGIYLSARCGTIKIDNYDKLLQQIRTDLEAWQHIQLSLMGRIATVKMTILPKMLFLFQTIPIKLKKDFFKDLDKIILKYVWQGKKPRIKFKALQDARSRGGFGLPNWELYYQAASLVWIKEWITLRNKRLLALEGHDLQLGWHAFVWYQASKIHGYFNRHQIRNSLLQTWEKIKEQHYNKIPDWISTVEAFTHATLFNMDKIIRYKDILKGNQELKSKQEIEEQGIEISWYTQLQIQSRYEKDKKTGFYREKIELDKILLGTDEKTIKKFYNYLLKFDTTKEQIKETMTTWTRNFGYTIDLDKWEKLWERNYKLTIATAYKENLYKMFYRWHMAPERLARMFKNNSAKCWKCQQTPGSYYHMWWTCVEAQKYWRKIKEWLEQITQLQIEYKPELFLLGIVPETYDKASTYLIIHILTAARIVFAQEWKSKERPREEKVITKILQCAEMNSLTLMIREKDNSEYYYIWNKFYLWLEQRLR